jgi:hypothetical protein
MMTSLDQAEAIGDSLLRQSLDDQKAKKLELQKRTAKRPGKWTLLGLAFGLPMWLLLEEMLPHHWPAVVGMVIAPLVVRLADNRAARHEHNQQREVSDSP